MFYLKVVGTTSLVMSIITANEPEIPNLAINAKAVTNMDRSVPDAINNNESWINYMLSTDFMKCN
jgi:hypothetical protein